MQEHHRDLTETDSTHRKRLLQRILTSKEKSKTAGVAETVIGLDSRFRQFNQGGINTKLPQGSWKGVVVNSTFVEKSKKTSVLKLPQLH